MKERKKERKNELRRRKKAIPKGVMEGLPIVCGSTMKTGKKQREL